MKKKYIVTGGTVISRSDGERHYITAQMLCILYGVHPSECYLIETNQPRWDLKLKGLPDLPRLLPKYDGNYKLYE